MAGGGESEGKMFRENRRIVTQRVSQSIENPTNERPLLRSQKDIHTLHDQNFSMELQKPNTHSLTHARTKSVFYFQENPGNVQAVLLLFVVLAANCFFSFTGKLDGRPEFLYTTNTRICTTRFVQKGVQKFPKVVELWDGGRKKSSISIRRRGRG